MRKKYKKELSNCGVGYIDSTGFHIIRIEPFRKREYKILPQLSTWIIKLKLKYPSPKPRGLNRISQRNKI